MVAGLNDYKIPLQNIVLNFKYSFIRFGFQRINLSFKNINNTGKHHSQYGEQQVQIQFFFGNQPIQIQGFGCQHEKEKRA
ncbi:hypothetical protein [Neisseria sp.]|uniref:hypothetical protein n=1 Tax=Neisseria sp. TaxID=192066 RepID=UPI0026DCEFFA|nr:hypothetical protein [Neisseria sp.]MDO4908161.1 hypothetical protein [Neisseria sp.]